jgi:hypothetical protein
MASCSSNSTPGDGKALGSELPASCLAAVADANNVAALLAVSKSVYSEVRRGPIGHQTPVIPAPAAAVE